MTDWRTAGSRLTVQMDGKVVRRPRQAWTPTVHNVLNQLRVAGVTAAPVPLTLDDHEETVSAIAGESGAACWPHQATDEGLQSAARLLRAVHDATAGWVPPSDAVWGVAPTEPAEIICHGDPGPWNMVWAGGRAIGLIDWDFCHPGPRREDVAYALEYLAPFRDDEAALRWHGFGRPPDRPGRIAAFCAAYGISAAGMVDVVIKVQGLGIEWVRALAAAGVHPQAEWVADGYLDELATRVAWSEQHRQMFE